MKNDAISFGEAGNAQAHSSGRRTHHCRIESSIAAVLLAIAIAVTSVGCATNKTQKLAPLKDSSRYAEVVVMRGKLIFGSGVAANITVDAFIVANLFTGKHIVLRLDPGEHSIGTIHGSASLELEEGKKYYFLVNVGYAGGFTTHRIEESEAMERLEKSKELNLDEQPQ